MTGRDGGDAEAPVPTWMAVAHRRHGVIELRGVVHPWTTRYRTSRILLVDEGTPRGWLEWTGRPPDAPALARAFEDTTGADTTAPGAAAAGAGEPSPAAAAMAPATLVVCTRDRAEGLRRCLRHVADALEPGVDVLVVDNAPTSGRTARLVSELQASGLPVRRVVEPRAGLSRARNTGMASTDSPVVAFIDDDVLVEPGWLRPLRQALEPGTAAAVALGMVPSAEIETLAQWEFERRLPWSVRLAPDDLSLRGASRRPPFPYNAGQIGTGANMAVRRQVVQDLGGFDTVLGAGTWTHGGEDLELFVRALRAGWDVAYRPASIVWHVHQGDMGALRHKVFTYGAGASAYFTRLLASPARRDVLAAVAPLLRFATGRRRETVRTRADLGLELWEALGLAWGPLAYGAERLRQRLENRPS